MKNNHPKIKGKKILITGGGGFIGSFLAEYFYKDNKVTLLDNGRRNALRFLDRSIQDQIKLIKGDILDKETVTKATKGQEIIIHLAAIAGASFYEKDPLLTLNVNFFGTANILEALVGRKFEKLIIFSTSEVYGPFASGVKEADLTSIGPVSEGRWSYAVSKVAADHLAMAYYQKYKMPLVIFRPFNIYGPRQVGEGAISNMLTSGLKEKRIFVTGDGLQKRSWCYISDLIDAVNLLCSKKISGECFNVGNPRAYVTILDLAKKIQSFCVGAKIVFIKKKKVEILDRRPNIDKAEKVLRYTPKIGLDEGLAKTYQWWSENITKF